MNFFTPDLSNYKLIDKRFITLHSNYSVLEKIGSGSFATVYRVVSKLDNKQYAIKKVNLLDRKNQSALKEASNLSFANDVLEVLHVDKFYLHSWTECGHLFLKLKLFPGDITRLFSDAYSDHFADKEFYSLFLQTASFMNLLHRNDYVHLDIKPSKLSREYSLREEEKEVQLSHDRL